MRFPPATLFRSTAALLVMAGCGLAVPALAQTPAKPALAKVEPVTLGDIFPAHTFNNINAATAGPARIDLGKVIGKRPIVFSYWIPRNKRSEEMILELQELLAGIDPSKIALYAVANPRPGMGVDEIRARASKIGLKVPVLEDEGFRLGQQLVVQTVPHLTLLDSEGNLQLVNGGSLRQDLEYKFTVKDAVMRAAKTGNVGSYGYLPKYYPAVELVGTPTPDFQAPAIGDGVVHRWTGLVDSGKLNILVFWSIDCPHCRKSIPEINRWFRKSGSGVNLVGVAKVNGDAQKTQTLEFMKMNGIEWLNIEDHDREIMKQFNVTSTPTIFILDPEGKIDTVLVSGLVGFAEKFDEKKLEFSRAYPGS